MKIDLKAAVSDLDLRARPFWERCRCNMDMEGPCPAAESEEMGLSYTYGIELYVSIVWSIFHDAADKINLINRWSRLTYSFCSEKRAVTLR